VPFVQVGGWVLQQQCNCSSTVLAAAQLGIKLEKQNKLINTNMNSISVESARSVCWLQTFKRRVLAVTAMATHPPAVGRMP
jgi:hypothetical protein